MNLPHVLLDRLNFLALVFAFTSIGSVTRGDVLMGTDFEGSSNLPSGWSQSQVAGAATWNIQTGGTSSTPATAHGGTKNATLFASNTNNNQTQLVSPKFSTVGYANLSLSFWHAQPVWSPDQDELKVFFSSNDGSTWTQLAHYTETASNWTERTLAITTTSTNSRIMFEGNAKWGYGVSIDDIAVSGILDSLSQVSVSVTDGSASEVGPDPGTWVLTRTGNTTGSLSVNFSMGGDATSSSDYNLDTTSPVIFGDGETTKVITLNPLNDSVAAEGDEIATLTLTSGTGYVVGDSSADISIYDDEGFELNILVIGSTHSYSEGGENDVVHQKPFDPTGVATHLETMLDQDTVLDKSVKVEFEDIFKFKTNTVRTSKSGINDITAHCYSLAQHFMWPDGKAQRLTNLRGEAGTKWDYIVLCSDPYIMANFPGMYAEGVKLIKDEAARSANATKPEVVLFAQWPENSSIFDANDFNEVVHRVGSSSELMVVPAGKAWASYASQDTNTAHPTPRGEYLAAASIYSKIYSRSATTSGYSFASDGANIANHTHGVVQDNSSVAQYSGVYATVTPFTMKHVFKRTYSFRETGTSTEDGLAAALHRLDDVCRITFVQNQGSFWDFNYGRGNDGWEDDKDYEVDPTKHDRSYGFPMHHYYTGSADNAAAQTMPYGIDKYYYGSRYEDGSDLGIAYNMVRPNTRETGLPEGHDVRAIPIRLMWLKMEQAWPGFVPLGDNTHMGPHLHDASVAFMYTLMTGRCPIVDEPATPGSSEWLEWLGHKTGYETAWQMSHLTTRSPGFKPFPSSAAADIVTTNAPETMTVRFMNPPTQNVTVNISSSNTAYGVVSTSTLTFTPDNYDVAQEITVTGVAADQGMQEFNVVFSTTSTDEIFDGLSDSWTYTCNTDPVNYGQPILLAGFDGTNTINTTSTAAGANKVVSNPVFSSTSMGNIRATLSTSDALEKSLHWAGMTSPATWGGSALTPTPTTTSNLIFAANQAVTFSFLIENTGSMNVTLGTLHFRLSRDNTYSANQVTIALGSGDLSSSGSGIQALSSGGANYDYDLSNILTDAILAAGESATITFSLAPTDPAGGRVRVDNMAISGQIASDYHSWSQLHSVGGAGDDDDLDGLNNEFERLFGLNPKSSNSSNPIVAPLNPINGQFSYTRRTQSLTGKTYKVMYSTNLSDWFEDTSANQSPGSPNVGVETVAVTLNSNLLLNEKLFIRVAVEGP